MATLSTTSASSSTAGLAASFASLPLRYEPNRGQSDAQVRYLAHGPGYTVFLTNSQAVIASAAGPRQAVDCR